MRKLLDSLRRALRGMTARERELLRLCLCSAAALAGLIWLRKRAADSRWAALALLAAAHLPLARKLFRAGKQAAGRLAAPRRAGKA